MKTGAESRQESLNLGVRGGGRCAVSDSVLNSAIGVVCAFGHIIAGASGGVSSVLTQLSRLLRNGIGSLGCFLLQLIGLFLEIIGGLSGLACRALCRSTCL